MYLTLSIVLLVVAFALGCFFDSFSEKLKLPNLGAIVTISVIGAVLFFVIMMK